MQPKWLALIQCELATFQDMNRQNMQQTIWVCIVCRKKQELLIKTGKWVQSGMAAKHREFEGGDIMSPITEKKPKLERAHSEGKENVDSRYSLGYSDRNRPLNERSPPGEVKRVRPADVTSRESFSHLHGNSSLESRGRYEGSSDPSYDRRKDHYPVSEPMDHHQRYSKEYMSDKEAPERWPKKSREAFQGADRRTGRDQQWLSQEEDRKVRSDSSIKKKN
ncbi:uncharacterized protein CEXT_200041 [Caerostris extrusa]|uniref:Uncharacterized protein n=1 Tax=Caerostris extrusa TaxID=172846 RepID=A0AAV4RHV3_CAEEX|nr:uncharacterized protein CEXT_200041 [Caerostris extrusa]